MTELDLDLKVASRRLLWRMGFSTRVDVPLRAVVPGHSPGATKYESFTDLDVLGIMSGPGFALRKVIADCKTSQRRSTERMFWIRGVADFFTADDAWMVRSGGVTAAARQLSARLGISVLEQKDLVVLESHHPTDLSLNDRPLAMLFDAKAVGSYMKAFTTLSKNLERLLEYREFDYWVYEEHRNLLQLVAHVKDAARNLDPAHPVHRALFYECVWLYTLSIAQASAHVRALHVTAIDAALQQYIFGGQLALQEKRRLAALLRRLAPEGVEGTDDGVLPVWYPQLLELVSRHLRQPFALNNELRYAEWLAEAQHAKETMTVANAFGGAYHEVACQLLEGVSDFLVAVADLDPGFRNHARTALGQPSAVTQEG
jgi:hypothetical protein